jgi:hypothetical protein
MIGSVSSTPASSGSASSWVKENLAVQAEPEPPVWWAGVATVLPRGSLVPPTGSRWLRRWNELRLDELPLRSSRRPVFRYPHLAPGEARRLAKPTCTGLGDLLSAWMMPMTLSELKGWQVRIPVPARAGGVHHDSSRPRLTPEWMHEAFKLPSRVTLVAAEAAPEGARWFCSLAQQWHLDSCMETSYETIPWWLRSDVDRREYYETYRRVARGLARATSPVFADGRAYCALNARRRDRGVPGDDAALRDVVSLVAQRWRAWAVVSDDERTASALRRLLREAGCSVAQTDAGEDDAGAALLRQFTTLAGAQVVVASVRGGWSAFPYAATRISGAPLVVSEALVDSPVWRVIRAHSRVPVTGIHHGPEGLRTFLASLVW